MWTYTHTYPGHWIRYVLNGSFFLSLIFFFCDPEAGYPDFSPKMACSIPSATQGLNQSLWPLTVLTQGGFSGKKKKNPENQGSGEILLYRVSGGDGAFLVSLLFSLGFSRYDPVVGPGGLEPGKGLANVPPQCF